MIALAVGTDVGMNTVMAAGLGTGQREEADEYAGVGTPLAIVLWLLFASICWLIMPAYARISTDSEAVVQDVVIFGRIVCIFETGGTDRKLDSKNKETTECIQKNRKK